MSVSTVPRLRAAWGWNFAGNATYSLAQWVLLLVLARLADPTLVGQFALALAVTAPIFLTVGLNLRVAQSSDASRAWHLQEYLVLRRLSNIVAILLSLGVGLALSYDLTALVVLFLVALAKSVEGTSQTYYGYFQQREQHRIVAMSLLARSFLGPAGFTCGFLATTSLAGACAGLAAGWLVAQVSVDRPAAARLAVRLQEVSRRDQPLDRRRIGSLARKAAPLGVDQGVSSLSVNVPRYAIEIIAGSASLGVFSGLSYLTQVISMVTSSLAVSIVPRMSRAYRDGRRRAFATVLAKLVLLSVVVTIVALAGVSLIGDWFVSATLGSAFVDTELLFWLTVGAGFLSLQRALTKSAVASQRYMSYLLLDSVGLISVLVSSWLLVPEYGPLGAAWSVAIGGATVSLISIVLLVSVFRQMPSQMHSGHHQ